MCRSGIGDRAGSPLRAPSAGVRQRAARRCRWQGADCSSRSQLAQTRRAALLRMEFEPDLQIAAVHVKFGDLVMLQKFDEFSQILNILFFHSFLSSPDQPATQISCRFATVNS